MKIQRNELEEKMWYRSLKVIFIIAYIGAILSQLIAIGLSFVSILIGESGMGEVILFIIITLIATPYFFRLIASIFFYVVTGQWMFVDFKKK